MHADYSRKARRHLNFAARGKSAVQSEIDFHRGFPMLRGMNKESKYGSWMSSIFFAMLLMNAFGAGIPWWVVWFPIASPLVSLAVSGSVYVTKHLWQRDSLVSLKAELLVAQSQLNALTDKWNALVKRVNDRGGEEFLSGVSSTITQFSKDEISQLIKLCHPDKHGGSEVAGEITKKLLLMRK